MDTISIKQLKVPTLIGAYPFERELQQTLIMDVSFSTDAKAIAQSDALNQAIDYDALSHYILEFGKHASYQLIETFAEKLSQSCLENFPMSWIKLDIQKNGAVKKAASVSISIERRK